MTEAIGLGVALGLVEGVLASFLFTTAAMTVATTSRSAAVPRSLSGWLALAGDGWAAPPARLARLGPPALALVAAALVAEEALARGVLLPALAEHVEAVPAVLLAALPSLAVRAYARPWPRIVHPLSYAAVLGVVNGGLYSASGHLLPLLVAQVTVVGFVVWR